MKTKIPTPKSSHRTGDRRIDVDWEDDVISNRQKPKPCKTCKKPFKILYGEGYCLKHYRRFQRG